MHAPSLPARPAARVCTCVRSVCAPVYAPGCARARPPARPRAPLRAPAGVCVCVCAHTCMPSSTGTRVRAPACAPCVRLCTPRVRLCAPPRAPSCAPPYAPRGCVCVCTLTCVCHRATGAVKLSTARSLSSSVAEPRRSIYTPRVESPPCISSPPLNPPSALNSEIAARSRSGVESLESGLSRVYACPWRPTLHDYEPRYEPRYELHFVFEART